MSKKPVYVPFMQLGHIGQLTENPIPQVTIHQKTTPSEKEFFKGLGLRIEELEARIKELEDGIMNHYKEFPDEPLQAEADLWGLVGIELYQDKQGYHKDKKGFQSLTDH